jgi:8-oxo-dGTP diphosphatase
MKKEDCYHFGIKALIKNKKGEILLLKVNKAKLSGSNGEYWDIPGGRVQRGDTVEDTLIREIEEETGIKKVDNIQPFSTVLSNIRIPIKPCDVGLILGIYTCEIDMSEAIRLSDEHVESGWFNTAEAAKLLEYKYPREFTDKLK